MIEEKILYIKNLFLEKKYSEIISLIEEIDKKNNLTAQLYNILGASITLKENPDKRNDVSLAIECFRKGYLKEKNTKQGLEALTNFINLSLNLYQYKDSIIYFKEAHNFFGYNQELFWAMSKVYKYLNDIDQTIYFLEQLIKNNDNSIPTWCSYIYFNSFKKDWSQKSYLEYAKTLSQKLPLYSQDKLINIKKTKCEKIKLAFLSGDIKKKHSVTYFLKTILNYVDREKYELLLFSTSKSSEEDETTDGFKKIFDIWININNLNDIKAINLIRDKKIDIIIDLMGITSSNRITLFKNRLAPTQISWMGYCNTTGLSEMDYIVSDPNLIKKEEQSLYSEKVITLANIWNCHSGFNLKRNLFQAPGINNEYITFGSFNNYNKISDEVVRTWSEILKKVNKSKLLLKSSLPHDVMRLKKKFENYGVIDSIIFSERKENFEDHLNLYKEIDIALDTFPYNGVTTSFEAIWMSVPVLTMKGFNFTSRCGESINKNINMEYLTAADENDYVLKAMELSNSPEKLLSIKKKLFDDAPSSSLFNGQRFSTEFFKSLEKIYYNL